MGLSPLTSHWRVAVSPFLTVTAREGAEKYGDAEKDWKIIMFFEFWEFH